MNSNRYRSQTARFLLLLYVGMLVNGILFLHAHRLADGTIITHAHPYKPVGKDPIQPNNHTQQELLWLDAVTNVLYTNPEPFFWLAVFMAAFTVPPAVRFLARISGRRHTAFRHRGPPVYVVI
ncbi:hypothetical protein BLX24_17535 [Arsenicibacter rosenii]|uniref:Uncharacterized protein n=1 Tax=Arsenicibacter rosenii TaxID=1750698 RepID=A0A1S2VI28_9BACT|nr:hypothetical protein BLX24_17535 [Arsenicibacter rosenii]